MADDDNWQPCHGDFVDESDSGNSDWEWNDDDIDDLIDDATVLDNDIDFELLHFAHSYTDENWQSIDTTLQGSKNNLCGPHPGPIHRQLRRAVPSHQFFNLFWPKKGVLDRIVGETN